MPASIARRAMLAAPLMTFPAFADDYRAALADIERRNGGRLGEAALDTATGRRVGHRMGERFPLCSTFKFLAAAFVLARVDRGEERLDRRIVFADKDLVTYSPVTKDHVGPAGLSVAEACEAAVTLSDNTAGNLLVASFGGPPALTALACRRQDGRRRPRHRQRRRHRLATRDRRKGTGADPDRRLLHRFDGPGRRAQRGHRRGCEARRAGPRLSRSADLQVRS